MILIALLVSSDDRESVYNLFVGVRRAYTTVEPAVLAPAVGARQLQPESARHRKVSKYQIKLGIDFVPNKSTIDKAPD